MQHNACITVGAVLPAVPSGAVVGARSHQGWGPLAVLFASRVPCDGPQRQAQPQLGDPS